MRKLTRKMMRPSEKLEMVGDDGNPAFSGEPERKGTPKFSLLLTPLDVGLLQDASGDDAHHQDCLVSPGVASTVEFDHDAGDSKRIMVRDRGCLRENGWAARY
jgi:hypothetical protein